MPTSKKIKELLLKTIFKKSKWETAKVLSRSPENPNKEIEDISVLHMWSMLLPRVHQEISKQWELTTGRSIPLSFEEVLQAAEKAKKTQRDS